MDGLIVNEAHLVDRRPKDEFMAKVRTTSPLAVKWKVDGVKSFNLCRCSRFPIECVANAAFANWLKNYSLF